MVRLYETPSIDKNYVSHLIAMPHHRHSSHRKHRRSSSKRRVPAVGSRAMVYHGTAHHTSGGLHKKDLKRSKGRIVSRRASSAAKRRLNRDPALKAAFRENARHMRAHGRAPTRASAAKA